MKLYPRDVNITKFKGRREEAVARDGREAYTKGYLKRSYDVQKLSQP